MGEMSTEQLDDFIKTAKEAVLGSPQAWDLLMESDPERFSLWLTETIQDIQNQLGERRSQFLAWKSAGRRTREDFAMEQGQYFAWKKSALRFKQSCEERKRQLVYEEKRKRAEAAKEKAEGKLASADERTQASQAHRDAAITRARAQQQHAVNSLADLASLVEAFIAGNASVDELDDALDDLTIQRRNGDLYSIRDLLAKIRESDDMDDVEEPS